MMRCQLLEIVGHQGSADCVYKIGKKDQHGAPLKLVQQVTCRQCVIGFFLMMLYPLTDAKLKGITDDLNQRREEADKVSTKNA